MTEKVDALYDANDRVMKRQKTAATQAAQAQAAKAQAAQEKLAKVQAAQAAKAQAAQERLAKAQAAQVAKAQAAQEKLAKAQATQAAKIQATQERLAKAQAAQVAKAQAAQERLAKAQNARAAAQGQRDYAKALDAVGKQAARITGEYTRIVEKIEALDRSATKAKASQYDFTAALTRVSQSANAAASQLARLSDNQTYASQSAEQIAAVQNQIASVNAGIEATTTRVMEKLAAPTEQTQGRISRAASGIKNTLARISGAFRSMGGKVKNALGGVVKAVKRTTSTAHRSRSIFSSLGRAIRSAFIIRTAMAGIRQLGQYMLSALKTNAQFVNSVARIKGNLLTAFAPIYQAVLPWLNMLMSALAKVTGYIAAFISGLFGKTYSESSRAAQGIQSAVDATNNQTDAMKRAAKEAKGALAPFDKFNDISKDTAGAEAGGNTGTIAPIFDTNVQMPDWMKDVLNGVTSWGTAIAERINGAFSKIDWKLIQDKAKQFSESLARNLNDFTATLDWRALGNTIAQGFNTVFDFAYVFVTTYDWSTLGRSISEAINSLVRNFDFAKAGKAISSAILGLLALLKSAIQEIDWYQIGDSVKEFLVNIDWAQIVRDLAYVFGQALAGLGQLLYGFIADAVASIREYFVRHIQDAGGDVVLGLLNGIIEGVKNIGIWLYQNVVKPFVDGFKSLFGIASPSKVMAELGVFVIQGLLDGIQSLVGAVVMVFKGLWNGIKDTWKTLSSWFDTTVVKPLGNLFENLRSNISAGWKTLMANVGAWFNDRKRDIGTGIDAIKSWWNNLINNITTWWRSLMSNIGDWFNARKRDFNAGIEAIKSWWNNLCSNVASWFSNLMANLITWFTNLRANFNAGIEAVKSWWNSMITAVKTWFFDLMATMLAKFANLRNGFNAGIQAIKEWFRDLWQKVSDWFTGSVNTIKSIFGSWKSNIQEGINTIKQWFSNLWTGIQQKASDAFNKVKDIIVGVFTKVQTTVTNIWDGILKAIKNVLNGIIGGINKLIAGLNKLSFDIPSWVPLIGGNRWGFKIPLIPTFAQGGFPEMGEMFIARERGPELVGKIGNKTAVANNDQIVKGIEAAVSNAMLGALAQFAILKGDSGSGESISIQMKLSNGETLVDMLIDPTSKVAKNRGYKPVFEPA